MATVRIVFLVGLQLCLPSVESLNENVFLTEPQNITVELGGVASFTCTTINQHQCGSGHWLYASKECNLTLFKTIGTCRSPALDPSQDKARFFLTFNDEKESIFTITDAKLKDAGYYAYLLTDETDGQPQDHSDCAYLTVVNPPTPICTSAPQNPSIGNIINLICEIPEDGKTSTELTWQWNSTSGHKQYTNTISPGGNYPIEYVLQDKDNFKQFTCVAGYDIDDGPRCSVYPLQIDMTVTVRLIPTNENIGSEGITVVFECNVVPKATHQQWALRNANGTQHRWMSVASGTQGRYNVTESARFLIITNVTDSDDGLTVTCTASNDNGMNMTSQPVTIIYCPEIDIFVTEGTDCKERLQTSLGPLNIFGLVVTYLIVFLAVISTIWHVIIYRREAKKQLTEPCDLKDTLQSSKVLGNDTEEMKHSESSLHDNHNDL